MKYSLKLMTALAILALVMMPAGGALAKKPKNVSLVSWGVGSMFYTMSSAVADGVKKATGIKTSIVPSSNDTGRVLPVKSGEAQLFIAAGSTGWLATRGAGIFSQPQWGPQPLRISWRGGAYYTGFWTRGDSGIKTLKDVKGKRVGQVPGSPTLNWLLQGAVAFGGYNMDQVKVVNMSGYGPGCKAVIQGSLDLFVSSTTSGYVRECAAKPSGIRWMDLKPSDKEAWKNLWTFAPWAGYGIPKVYAGKSKGVKPFTTLKYAAFFWSFDNTDTDTVLRVCQGHLGQLRHLQGQAPPPQGLGSQSRGGPRDLHVPLPSRPDQASQGKGRLDACPREVPEGAAGQGSQAHVPLERGKGQGRKRGHGSRREKIQRHVEKDAAGRERIPLERKLLIGRRVVACRYFYHPDYSV